MHDPMNCPGCATPMTAMSLDARLGGTVEFYVCVTCQAFWFGQFKSLSLAPASTLKLMKFIGENPPKGVIRYPDRMQCPYCRIMLLPTHDIQRNTPFQYWRCDQEHGRFIGFLDFLREKDYIRPLTQAQIDELRQNIQILNCSHCGAPIDLTKESTCTHCGSPLSLLDMKHPQNMLNELKGMPNLSQTNPTLSSSDIARIMSVHDADTSFKFIHFEQQWWSDVPTSGLLQACLNVVARWMEQAGE